MQRGFRRGRGRGGARGTGVAGRGAARRGRARGASGVSVNARDMAIRNAVSDARRSGTVASEAVNLRARVLPALGISTDGGRYRFSRMVQDQNRANIFEAARQMTDPSKIGVLRKAMAAPIKSTKTVERWELPGLHPASAVLALRDLALKTDTPEFPYGITITIGGTTATGDEFFRSRIVDATFLERSDAMLQGLLSGSVVGPGVTYDSDAEFQEMPGLTNLRVIIRRQRLKQTGASNESGGSFWKYWVDELFPEDLSFLQVFKHSQRADLKKKLLNGEDLGNDAYELDCFGNALMQLNCPVATLLKYYELIGSGTGAGANRTMFSGTQAGWLPTNKIRELTEKLKINVALTYYDRVHSGTNDNIKTWQGDEQSDKWYPIGRLAGHYFKDTCSGWTHWAATHLKQIAQKIDAGEMKPYEAAKLKAATGFRPHPTKPGQTLLKANGTIGKISYGRLLVILLYGVSGEITSAGAKRKREDESKSQAPLMRAIEPDDYLLSTNLHHMFRNAMQARNLPMHWNDGNFEDILKECAKKKDRTQQKIFRWGERKREAIANTAQCINHNVNVQHRMHGGQLEPLQGEEWQRLYDGGGLDKHRRKHAFWDKFTHLASVKNKEGKNEIIHVPESFTIVAFDFETDTATNSHHTAYMCSVAYYVYANHFEHQGYYQGDPYDYRDLDLGQVSHEMKDCVTELGDRYQESTGRFIYATPDRYNGRAKLIKKTFMGEDCAMQLHDFLNDTFVGYHVLAIAHNLRYDLNLFMEKSRAVMKEAITKSTSRTNTACVYLNSGRGLCINFLDSYALISHPLRAFGDMFDLGGCKKEIMPYAAYTLERLNTIPFMRYEEVREYLESDEQLQEFIALAEYDAKAQVENKPDMFSLWKYAQFYCERDCEVLLRGFNVNRAVLYNMEFSPKPHSKCKLDVVFATSSAQYASSFAAVAGCYEDTYVFSGTLREYLQRAVVGGRVMVAMNMPHATKKLMNDFDAVSLYPSAMHRLSREIGGFPLGKPKLWNPGVDLKANDIVTYYITVRITYVGQYLQFPLLSIIDEDGGRHFTNNLVGHEIVVDRVAWEDAQEFQDMKGDILCGIYFDSGVNPKIAEVIDALFKKRLELKKEDPETGKALDEAGQQSIKLIMNSIYGRTIMNPIDKKMEFKYSHLPTEEERHDEIMTYIYKHSVSISEFYFVRPDFCIIYRHQPIIDHWSAPHIGALILSMSKRIMNEVIVEAERSECHIHYQDTDSMHIDDADLEKLATGFKKIYGRDLVGKGLGQFHNDFKRLDGHHGAVSVEGIFVGKKMYADKVRYTKNDSPGEYTYVPHLRMKGIPGAVLKKAAKLNAQLDPRIHAPPRLSVDYCMDIYRDLLAGKSIKFDMTSAGGCQFEGSKKMVTMNKAKFERTVRLNKSQYDRALFERNTLTPFSYDENEEQSIVEWLSETFKTNLKDTMCRNLVDNLFEDEI